MFKDYDDSEIKTYVLDCPNCENSCEVKAHEDTEKPSACPFCAEPLDL